MDENLVESDGDCKSETFDQPKEGNCESCSEHFKFEKMFKCTSCMAESETTIAVFCELCILSHVRRGHEIVNDKQQKPAICEDHKNICSIYCISCDVIMCSNCISLHKNHSFMSVEERAGEVRSEVFEIISELDSCDKKIRGTQERIHERKEKRAENYAKLVETVSSQIDAFKQKVLNHIGSEHEKTVKIEQEAEENYETLLKCQGSLRELLSCSDGIMVEQFIQTEKSVSRVKSKEAELELIEIKGVDYKVSEQAAQLVMDHNNYLEALEMPEVIAKVKCTDEFYVYSERPGKLFSDNMYCVRIQENEISVNRIRFDYMKDNETIEMKKIKLATKENLEGKNEIQAFFYEENSETRKILIVTPACSYVFDIAKSSFQNIELNLKPHHVPLFLVGLENNLAQFIFWDRNVMQLRQSNKSSLQHRCEFLPRVVSACHQNDFVHIVDQSNDVVEIDTRNIPKILDVSVIKFSTHCVKHISCISHIRNNVLIIWSLSTKSLTFLHRLFVGIEYSHSFLIPFGDDVAVSFTAPVISDLRFLVAAKIEDKNGKLVDKMVFMIKDAL